MQISELFVSLQGEGFFTGTPAAFIRLAGCNLKCPFCDTNFQHTQTLSEQDITRWAVQTGMTHIVITGGEPTLQLTASLLQQLHHEGLFIQIETNGTRPLPPDCQADWVTCSPKSPYTNEPIRLTHIDELKVIFTSKDDPDNYNHLAASVRCLQPCDTGDERRNEQLRQQAISYCLHHPQWRLSLQTHKLLGLQ